MLKSDKSLHFDEFFSKFFLDFILSNYCEKQHFDEFCLISFRFKALDRLDADRKLMLFQHLGFVHCPIREHCPAFPNCMDSIVERIVAKKAHNSSGSTRPSSWTNVGDNNHLNLVMLGSDNLTHTMERQVRSVCNSDDEFMLNDEEVFSLDYRCVSGDVSLPENAFRTQDFLPHGKSSKKMVKIFDVRVRAQKSIEEHLV